MRLSRSIFLAAAIAATACLSACHCDDKDGDAKKASAGMVGEKKSGCCSGDAAACTKDKASMGAVSEKKAGCCSGKTTTTTN